MERTIIIGAGMAGLAAADVASKYSREVIVLEKDATDLAVTNTADSSENSADLVDEVSLLLSH